MLLFAVLSRLSLAGLAILLVVGSASAPAGAAGVRDLDRVPFDRPYIEVLGASSAGVLYQVSRDQNRSLVALSTWVKPTGAPAYQVDLSFRRLAGDKIFGASPTGVTYQYIGTPLTRRCDDEPQPALPAQRYDGVGVFASFGWISGQGERVEVSATGCRVTAKYPDVGSYSLIAMDELGYLTISELNSDGDKQLTYRSYAAPTQPRVIADGGHRRFLGAVSLAGSAVSWSHLDYSQSPPSSSSFVVRSSSDGSVAPKATRIPGWVQTTSIAGGTTSWTTCQQTMACASGSIAADGTQTQVTDTGSVVRDGARFVFDTQSPSPGVVAAAAVGGPEPKTRIAAVDLLPPVAHVVSVGAGGVAYLDTQLPADSFSRRFYSQSGTTISLGAQTKVGQTLSQRLLSREGRRMAFVDASGVLWLVADDGVRTRVFAPADRVAEVGGTELRISGSRLLWWKGKYTGEQCDMHPVCWPRYDKLVPVLYDLRTGVSTELQLSLGWTGYQGVDLWGNFLAWADAQNAIWRRDLHSGAVLQVKAAGTASVRSVAVHDDWVAWATCRQGEQDDCEQSVLGHRNMQTRAAAIQLTSAHTGRVRLSGGHVVYDTYPSNIPSAGTVKVWRLGTSATGVVGPVRWRSSFDVHDETLVWIAPDEVARIGPNSPFVAYPKYLGNGSAPASFSPAVRSWTAEFGISKALPTCSMSIKSGTTVRRVLGCATTTGSARAVWDGRDSAGRLLPKGVYTWTLAGRDTDGTLRWWTGATHPITGTVRIV